MGPVFEYQGRMKNTQNGDKHANITIKTTVYP